MHALVLLALGSLQAQEHKPIDKDKARELMDLAHAGVSAAHLEIQVASLRDLGDLYRKIDRAKALEVLEQAFAGAYRLPDEKDTFLRSNAQGQIVQRMALIDETKALEKLASLPASAAEGRVKPEAYEKVIQQLVSAGKLDQAVEALSGYGEGVYPYRALNVVMKKLPEGDGRRVILFGLAAAAYSATPAGDFGTVVLDNWEQLPRESVQAAAAAIVSQMLKPADEDQPRTTLRLGAGNDTLRFTEQEFAIYKLLKVVKAVDPKRLDEIFEKRPTLKAAFEKAPGGVKEDKVIRMTAGAGDRMQASLAEQQMALSMARMARLRDLAAKDPEEALKSAEAIPDADARLQALIAVVDAAGEKQPKLALRAAAEAFAAMEKAKDSMAVAMALMSVMGGVMENVLENKDMVKDAAEWRTVWSKAVPVAEMLLKSDTDKENPNTSPRDTWPSTQTARMAMLLAGRVLGVDAIPMLEQWRDVDLRLVATVALARALAGEMPTEMSVHVGRAH